MQLKIVDAGDLFYSWRWEHALDQPRAIQVPRSLVSESLAALAAALPSPLAGESLTDALERALRDGPLTDRARESRLLGDLARSLIPFRLAGEMNDLLARGIRPHLRVQPSPSLAQVPWEALRIDEGERLVHVADVSVLTPATVRNALGRQVSPWEPGGRVVGVFDPRIPGFADASELGSVLGDVDDGSPLARALEVLGTRLDAGLGSGSPFRRSDATRDWLEATMRGASRMLYVGHVSAGGTALDARMHLSDGAVEGRAGLIREHRPLSAADIVLGHRPDAIAPWKAPNRVALIACESGGEVRYAEPAGLVSAFVHAGAEYVTTTRWTLPTDAGLRRFLDQDNLPEEELLAASVVAVNAAHEAPDPVAALGAWQAEQATGWETTGQIEYSPVMWAAFSTAYAPSPSLR